MERGEAVGARDVLAVVTPMAEEAAAGLGLEVVDVEYRREGGGWVLRVFIDKPGGVTLDDCQAVSHALGQRLDEADPIPNRYSLEVSSPGIERPLKRPADFERFAGLRVQIRTFAPLDGRRNFKGELVGLVEGAVVVRTDTGQVAIPQDMVARANLVAEF